MNGYTESMAISSLMSLSSSNSDRFYRRVSVDSNSLFANRELLEKTIESMKATFEQMSTEVQQYVTEFETGKKAFEEGTLVAKQIQTDLSGLQKSAQDLEKQKKDLNGKIIQLTAASSAALQAALDNEKVFDQVTKQFKQDSSSLDATKAKVVQEFEKVKATLNAKEAEAGQVNERLQALRLKLETMEKNNAAMVAKDQRLKELVNAIQAFEGVLVLFEGIKLDSGSYTLTIEQQMAPQLPRNSASSTAAAMETDEAPKVKEKGTQSASKNSSSSDQAAMDIDGAPKAKATGKQSASKNSSSSDQAAMQTDKKPNGQTESDQKLSVAGKRKAEESSDSSESSKKQRVADDIMDLPPELPEEFPDDTLHGFLLKEGLTSQELKKHLNSLKQKGTLETEINKVVNGWTPLQVLIMNGQPGQVLTLLRFGPRLDVTINGWNLMHLVAMSQFMNVEGCERILKHLLDNKIPIDGPAELLPTNIAAWYGRSETLEALLKLGAGINRADKKGFTPLHFACMNTDDPSVALKLLATLDIKPMLLTNDGQNAMHLAVIHGCEKIVKALLKTDCDPNAKDKNNNRPLDYAGSQGAIYDILAVHGCYGKDWKVR